MANQSGKRISKVSSMLQKIVNNTALKVFNCEVLGIGSIQLRMDVLVTFPAIKTQQISTD